ncbi:MAG: cyclase family protein [Actinomycetota bacterium]|nr:cyclase family protein [Actinomycetota bacterium]
MDTVGTMGAALSNWGRWGHDDELGCVNFITGERRQMAAGLVREGKAFSLALPLDRNGPQPPTERRLNPQHVMLQTGTELHAGVQRGAVGGWGYADDMVTMALQCGTHWDALAHAFYNYKMYNGRDCTLVGVEGAVKNGINVLRDAVAGRAVLCDVAEARSVEALDPDHRITVADLERTLAAQAVAVQPGDVLLIRTGHLGRIRSSGTWHGLTYSDEPGIGLDVMPWIHDHQVAAVAADNWALEVLPSGAEIMLPVHAVGIVYMGLLLGELFDLDDLAEDCRRDGIFEMLLVAPPLPFTGAVGSPVNPIALK